MQKNLNLPYNYAIISSMTAYNERKLKTLFDSRKYGAVCLAPWLEKKGISRDLQQYYCKSGWLKPIGRGAFRRSNDAVSWQDALHALIGQAELNVHIGGMTALSQQGAGHYVRLGRETVFLFSPLGVSLPAWFGKYEWGVDIEHIKTNFLPSDELIKEVPNMELGSEKEFTAKMFTSSERAILECLYLAPKRQDLMECYQVMEGLVNLRPKVVQGLLEACTSIKVKRLFLYMAEKADHQWLQYVDLANITFGKGDRSIVKNGVYIAKNQIIVPAELAAL